MDKTLPLAPMEKLLKKGNPELRISDPAKEELRIYLEDKAAELAKVAADYALHAGRKTIKASDVRLAAKRQ